MINISFIENENKVRTWTITKVKGNEFKAIECTTDEMRDLLHQLQLQESFDWQCPF
jgi:hypothetical protein